MKTMLGRTCNICGREFKDGESVRLSYVGPARLDKAEDVVLDDAETQISVAHVGCEQIRKGETP